MSNFNEGDLFDNRYKLEEYLGGGELAEVWKVWDELAGITVVLKIYVRAGDAGIRQFIKDFTLTESLNHDYILRPSHVAVCDRRPYLILKYYNRGSVANRIDSEHEQYSSFSESDIANFMIQIGSALNYLHGHDILHRDIKPDNILLGENGEFVLTDFGISKKARNSLSKSTSSTQVISFSRPYAPPEVLTNNDDIKKDIFSLGVTMYELLTEDLPFEGNGGTALLMGGELPDLPQHFPSALNKLIRQCMSRNPADRPSAADIESWGKYFKAHSKWPQSADKPTGTRAAEGTGQATAKVKETLNNVLKSFGSAGAGTASRLVKWKDATSSSIPSSAKPMIIYGVLAVALTSFAIAVYIIWPAKATTTAGSATSAPAAVTDTTAEATAKQIAARLTEGKCQEALGLIKQARQAYPATDFSRLSLAAENCVSASAIPTASPNVELAEAEESPAGNKRYDDAMKTARKFYKSGRIADAYLAYKKACSIESNDRCKLGVKVCRATLEKDFKELIATGENNDKTNPSEALNAYRKAAELASRTSLFESQISEKYSFYVKEGTRYLDRDNNKIKAKRLFEFAQVFHNDQRIKDLLANCQ